MGGLDVTQNKLMYSESNQVVRTGAENPVGAVSASVSDGVARAWACCRAGDWDEAERVLRQALATQPFQAELATNLGAVLFEAGRYEGARDVLAAVLKRDCRFAPALYNLANVELVLGEVGAAATLFRQVAHAHPKWAPAFANLGHALRLDGRLSEASAALTRALVLNGADACAHYNLALVRLAQGRFAEAWPHYEWRIMQQTGQDYVGDPRRPAVAMTRPSRSPAPPPTRQRVLILHDQGLGDELFFLRFAHAVKRPLDTWTYLTSPRFAPIAQQCAALDEVVSTLEEERVFDSVISIGDLPQWLNPDLPLPPPLTLNPNTHEVARLQKLFANRPRPYLGLTWRAGIAPTRTRPNTVFKQVDLSALASAIRMWPGTLFIVQRDPQRNELKQLHALFGERVVDCSAMNNELETMTALLALLDTYVCVSNTNTHLWAGLGRRGHVLVPRPAEWRWLAQGDQSPWFPQLHLYRQARDGDWVDALDALRARIQCEFTARSESGLSCE